MDMSVIIPTYKRPDYLKRCFLSLLKQSSLPDEIVPVVVSDDVQTKKVCRDFEERLRKMKIRLLCKSINNPSFINALNCGLAYASGDIVCFTDDDAEPFLDWLEKIKQHFKNEKIAGVGGRVVLPWKKDTLNKRCSTIGKKTWYGKFVGNHHLKLEPQRTIEVDHIRGVNMAFRKSSLEGYSFDEKLLEPWCCNEIDLCLHLKSRGWKIVYDPLIKVNHRSAPRKINIQRDNVLENILPYSHNYTYIMLKNLSFASKVIFVMYNFLIGQRHSLGLITAFIDSLLNKRMLLGKEVFLSYRGKIEGTKTYLRQR